VAVEEDEPARELNAAPTEGVLVRGGGWREARRRPGARAGSTVGFVLLDVEEGGAGHASSGRGAEEGTTLGVRPPRRAGSTGRAGGGRDRRGAEEYWASTNYHRFAGLSPS
jgi:hypothetical protein